jgi:putative ABC transport system permease protein
VAPYLYVPVVLAEGAVDTPAILAGTSLREVIQTSSWWKVEGEWRDSSRGLDRCIVGSQAARLLNLKPGDSLNVVYAEREINLEVAAIVTTGSSEDSQVLVDLGLAQRLAGLSGRIGLVQVSVQGTPETIEIVRTRLSAALPEVEVRPVRQLAEAEGYLFDKIRGLLLATVTLISILTSLGVLAAMTGLALERRRDVGLMKALGGTVGRIMRFFLVETTAVGFIGGLIGCAAGTVLAAWMEWRIYGTTMTPRLIVWPFTIALMIAVALAGSLPLRFLGRVRPAEILRNE